MTNTEPKIPDADTYLIGETAAVLGISRHTVNKYLKDGFIRCGIRRCNNKKIFTGAEIKRFWRSRR